MNQKIIIFALSFLSLVGIILILVVIFNKPDSPTGPIVNNTNSIQPLPTPTIPAGDKITLATNSGSVVVNNFFKSAVKIIESSVYLTESDDYSIIYFNNGSEFLVSLNAYGVNEARAFRSQAEYSFMQSLGISQTDACKLTVHTKVPASYNIDLSDQDYRLSFCPNGIQF